MKNIFFLLAIFFASKSIAQVTLSGAGGDDAPGVCAPGHCPDCPHPPRSDSPFPIITPAQVESYDPNHLIPPESVGEKGWIRRDQILQFTIQFENDPDSATAAAQRVEIWYPFEPAADPSSLRLHEFGFGIFSFTVPDGAVYPYTELLPTGDSLGVDVRFTAGFDMPNNRAYWLFESIDTLTGEPTLDPLAGFLPVNIKAVHNGEGFVTFSILPKPDAQTFDSIDSYANIFFDFNPPVPTPMALNTIDADAPVSAVSPTVTAPDAAHLRLHWSGSDIGSGLMNYTLFVAENGGDYTPWLLETDSTSGLLPATEGNTYRILCVARDSVRNAEQKTLYDREITFQRWFPDADGDGYGDAGVEATVAGTAPAGYLADHSDCTDSLAAINPGAAEICNGIDDNCDGLIDHENPNTNDRLVLAAIKVFLQGPYVGAAQLMHDSLRVKGLIPLQEPYTGLAGFTQVNGGGEQTTPAVLSVTGPDAIVDWVFLELRSAADPAQVLATRPALLQRDGDVVEVDGISPVAFSVVAGQSYFLAARHRNHLGVQLGGTVFYPECDVLETDFRALPPEGFYDFNGLNPAQKLIGSTYVLWAGNGRTDFQLKYNGSNNDRTSILSVVGLTTPNAVAPGYNLADYNLDGVVKYNGSANDRNVLLGNVGIATPSGVVHDQVAR